MRVGQTKAETLAAAKRSCCNASRLAVLPLHPHHVALDLPQHGGLARVPPDTIRHEGAVRVLNISADRTEVRAVSHQVSSCLVYLSVAAVIDRHGARSEVRVRAQGSVAG